MMRDEVNFYGKKRKYMIPLGTKEAMFQARFDMAKEKENIKDFSVIHLINRKPSTLNDYWIKLDEFIQIEKLIDKI